MRTKIGEVFEFRGNKIQAFNDNQKVCRGCMFKKICETEERIELDKLPDCMPATNQYKTSLIFKEVKS